MGIITLNQKRDLKSEVRTMPLEVYQAFNPGFVKRKAKLENKKLEKQKTKKVVKLGKKEKKQ